MAFMLTDLEVDAAAQRTDCQVDDGNVTEFRILHGKIAILVQVKWYVNGHYIYKVKWQQSVIFTR